MSYLRQNTAVTIQLGPFVDETDGNTFENGLSIGAADVLISKNHGNFAAKSDVTVPASTGNGRYSGVLAAADVDTLGHYEVQVQVAGALYWKKSFTVISQDEYDAKVAGTGVRAANVTQVNGVVAAAQKLAQIAEFGDYLDGAVWLDSDSGNSGQVAGEDGTVRNSVNQIADALAIAAAINSLRIRIAPDSSVTLASAVSNHELIGSAWTLNLGGQAIANALISGAIVAGTAISGGTFDGCSIGNVTIDPSSLINCALTGTLTVPNAGEYALIDCYDGASGSADPVIDFASQTDSVTCRILNYHGNIEIRNLGFGSVSDILEITGKGRILMDATCIQGSVRISGDWEIVDSSSGVTVTVDAAISRTAIQSSADAALVANHLDHLLAVDTPAPLPGTAR